jgi:cytochrome c-type biogenesis protein CcmH/NrfG
VQLGLAQQARGQQEAATSAFEEAARLDPLSSVVRVTWASPSTTAACTTAPSRY